MIHSKLRSWLTIIGIVIGVGAIIAIVSIGEGAQLSVQERLGGLGADLITISPGFDRASGGFRMGFGEHGMGGEGNNGGANTMNAGGATSKKKNITDNDIGVIKSIEGIDFVNGVVSGKVDISYLAESASVSAQGVEPLAWKNIVTTELESGRYLAPGDTNVIVIGGRIAKSTFKQPLAINRAVDIEGHAFKVVDFERIRLRYWWW